MKKALTLLIALALLLGLAQPALTEAGGLPSCFIPQVTAQYFNGLLEQMFQTLGAPDPTALAEQYKLTKAQDAGTVLYLSSANGQVEINAFYSGGGAAIDKPASTLTLAVANDVDRSEMLSLAATLAVIISETDSSAGDFNELLNWMSDAADGKVSNMRSMNGYILTYAQNDRGSMYTLIANSQPEDGAPAPEPTEAPAPEPTEAPTPEPTEAPTPEPTEAPTPEPTEAPSLPQSLDGAILEWEGFALKPVRYDIHAFSSDYVTMHLFCRLLNNTDQYIRVQVSDISIDGVEVYSTGVGDVKAHSDTGDDTSDFAMISPDFGDNEAAGLKAIAFAKKVKMTLVLKDEDFNKLYTQQVTIDLDDLDGERDVPDDFKASPKTSSSSSSGGYRSLCKGDKGDDVKALQQKLIDLGWLCDTADGQFGPKTASAVKAFNEANGLGSSSVASVETQEKLFSSSAKGYSEPWIPVDLPYTQWRNMDSDGASYRVKITNTSKTRTIKGIALQYYVTDVWGTRPWGSTIYREFTNTETIKPGQTKYSQWWYMGPSWYNIDMIHFRVARVAFDDGTVHENYDEDYNWTVSLH